MLGLSLASRSSTQNDHQHCQPKRKHNYKGTPQVSKDTATKISLSTRLSYFLEQLYSLLQLSTQRLWLGVRALLGDGATVNRGRGFGLQREERSKRSSKHRKGVRAIVSEGVLRS